MSHPVLCGFLCAALLLRATQAKHTRCQPFHANTGICYVRGRRYILTGHSAPTVNAGPEHLVRASEDNAEFNDTHVTFHGNTSYKLMKLSSVDCSLKLEDWTLKNQATNKPFETTVLTCHTGASIQPRQIFGVPPEWARLHRADLASRDVRATVKYYSFDWLDFAATASMMMVSEEGPELHVAPSGQSTDVYNPNPIVKEHGKWLVLRVQANDVNTSMSEVDLAANVYGSDIDLVNVKDRLERCSNSYIKATPFDGQTSTGQVVQRGVFTIHLNMDVINIGAATAVFHALMAANTALGTLAQFQHVLVCLPPAVQLSFVAYSQRNGALSVYNDDIISQASVQMHQIGHNLGLTNAAAWTGMQWDEYGDSSGFMGFIDNEDEAPVMCFNGVKNWQLGWFGGAYSSVDWHSTSGSHNEAQVRLIGAANYDKDGPAESFVVVKVETGTEWDFYLSFNSAVKSNAGTRSGVNKVLVHCANADGAITADKSYLYASLASHELFDLPDGIGVPEGSSLRITVADINLHTNPAYADVTLSTTAP